MADKHFKHLFSISFPQYITAVKVSEKRNPKYYSISSGVGRVQKLPKALEKAGFTIDKKGFYLNKNGERVISNIQTVGTPNVIPINNQYIYAQKGGHFTRSKIVNGLRDYFIPIILEKIKPIPLEDFPITIECELHAVPNNNLPDGDNFGSIYYKVFADCLTYTGIIPDDKFEYISKPGSSPLFSPIKDEKNRLLIFHFYSDTRPANKEYLKQTLKKKKK